MKVSRVLTFILSFTIFISCSSPEKIVEEIETAAAMGNAEKCDELIIKFTKKSKDKLDEKLCYRITYAMTKWTARIETDEQKAIVNKFIDSCNYSREFKWIKIITLSSAVSEITDKFILMNSRAYQQALTYAITSYSGTNKRYEQFKKAIKKAEETGGILGNSYGITYDIEYTDGRIEKSFQKHVIYVADSDEIIIYDLNAYPYQIAGECWPVIEEKYGLQY